MELKIIFSSLLFVAAFLSASSQVRVRDSIPASIYYKIKPHNTLNRQELLLSNIIDSALIVQSVNEANFDTTVSLNHSISWFIIGLNDSTKECINYFLVTTDLNNQRRISYKKLYTNYEVNIAFDFFTINEYRILSNDHLFLIASTRHRLVHRQNFDEKTGDIVKISHNKKVSLWIKQDGEIIQSRKAPK